MATKDLKRQGRRPRVDPAASHCLASRAQAPEDRGEHPSSGRLATVSDYTEQAQRYLVLIEGGPPSNYSAWSPDLPGCVATGDSLEHVEREMRAAIAFHLEGSPRTAWKFRSRRAQACTSNVTRARPRSRLLETLVFRRFRALLVI